MRVTNLLLLATCSAITCAPAVHAESSKKILKVADHERSELKSVGTKRNAAFANVASQTNDAAQPPATRKTKSTPAASSNPHRVALADVDAPSDPSTNAGTKNQAAITDAQPVESAPKPKPPQLKATINLSAQTMTVASGGAIKHVFKISSGRAGYRTPTGTFKPQWMSRMHYSKKYDNAPMPHSVFFHKGYAVHATYATRRLGAPASHGCIRLSPSNAKKFYYLVQKYGKSNTQISIHGIARDRVYAGKKKKTYRARKKYASIFQNPFSAPSVYKKPARRRYRTRSKPYVTGTGGAQTHSWPGD